MNKIVITTSITNGYNILFEPQTVPSGCDFVLFTDTPDEFKSEVWDIRKIEEPVDGDPIRTARKYKILMHKYLSEYEISIRIDGNMLWRGDNDAVDKAVNTFLNGYNIAISQHSQRGCVYDEIKACQDLGKANKEELQAIADEYRNAGFPEQAGLMETGVTMRRHNESDMVALETAWFNRIKNGPPRDQIYIMYLLITMGIKYNKLVMHVRRNPYVLFDAKTHRLSKGKR